MTLNKLDIIVDRLEKENKNLKVIFISIDPDRDTPKVMRDYINSFNSNFIGITGKTEKIFLLSRSWGIISEKIFSENGEYSVNHSSPVILLKNGKFVARLTHRDDIKQSLKIIKKYL
jgi:protein SCO1/2